MLTTGDIMTEDSQKLPIRASVDIKIKESTQMKIMKYSKEFLQKSLKAKILKSGLNSSLSKLDLSKVKEDMLVSSKNMIYLKL